MDRLGLGSGGFSSAHLAPWTHTPELAVEDPAAFPSPLAGPVDRPGRLRDCRTLFPAACLGHSFEAQEENE